MSYPFGRTKRVDGGLKARSTRGAIGETWWSQRFIAVLESFSLGTRLTRGRNYARQGQVLALNVAPGVVTSQVQGSRPDPYGVEIAFRPLPDRTWQAVEEAITAQALFTARLLAGDMPPSLEDVFTSVDAPLFPRSAAELKMTCTCPDDAVPCKHIAATFYLLAEAFDDDPFHILLWRGRTREALLAHLGSADSLPDEPPPSPFEEVNVAPLEDMLDRFWVTPVPLPDRPPTLPTAPDLLLRQLPTPPPTLGGASLIPKLRPLYETFTTEHPDG